MSGRGDQAVFTIYSILNGFLGRVKSVAPILPDGGCVLLITADSFSPIKTGIWMKLVEGKITIAGDDHKADGYESE